MVALTKQAHADVLAALSVSNIPDVHWLQGDDLCDCVFQRVGEWTNPYLAKTLRVRLCCIWAEIYKQFPQFVQDIDAYYDLNRHAWVEEPREWDSADSDMPLPLWYRQLARRDGRSVAAVREENRGKKTKRPKAVKADKSSQPTVNEVEQARAARLRLTGWL